MCAAAVNRGEKIFLAGSTAAIKRRSGPTAAHP
jgi:hypothetical protein